MNDYLQKRVGKKMTTLHRHIMERSIGRELTDDEIVHHKNGDKFDNRLDNLEIVARGQHTREHKHDDKYRRADYQINMF